METPTRRRSILKRSAPPPLTLGPSASFNITVVHSPISSPSCSHTTSALQSPHVHFPPSASLTATFIVPSPNSYDRGAIQVSPNPLAIPTWGDRVWSPSGRSLRSPTSPGGFKNISGGMRSPGVLNFKPSPPSSPVVGSAMGEGIELQAPPTPKVKPRFHEMGIQLQPSTRGLPRSSTQPLPSPYPSVTTLAERKKNTDDGIQNRLGVRRSALHEDSPVRGSKQDRLERSAEHDLSEALWMSASMEEENGAEHGSPRPFPARVSIMTSPPHSLFGNFPSLCGVLSSGEEVVKLSPLVEEN